MAKKIIGFIKLQVPAGKANPVAADRPGAGSARPEHHGVLQGVQRPDPGHRARPADAAGGDHRVRRQVASPSCMKTPPATVLIKKAAKLDKGSPKPHTDKVGKLTRAQVEEIAKTKQPDLTAPTSTPQCAPSPVPPARWASRWKESDNGQADQAPEGDRAARSTATSSTRSTTHCRSSRNARPPSSTSRSTSPFNSAWMQRSRTRSFAARSSCRTAPARPSRRRVRPGRQG